MSDAARPTQRLMARFMNRFAQVVRQAQVYGDRHPALDAAVDEVLDIAREIDLGDASLSCLLASPYLVVAGAAHRPPSELQTALADLETFFRERGLGGIQLTGALEERALLQAVRTLIDLGGDGGPGPEPINAELSSRGIGSIEFLEVRAEREHGAVGGAGDAVLASMRLYLRGVRAIQRLLDRGVSPAMELELKQIAAGLVAEHSAAPDRLMILATPRQLVPYALRHPVHMAILSIALGSRFGMTATELEELALCALMVDAGMGAVDEEVRNAAGALTNAELASLRLHPLHTVQRLLTLPVLSVELRRRVVVGFEHHLGVDWQGYPAVNRWTALHPYSRIVSAADGYDALRANRPGRPGMPTAAALEVMHGESGTRYDPLVVEHLESIVREHLEMRNAARA